MHYLFSHKQTTSRWWPWLYTSPTSSFSQCNHSSFKLIVFLTVFPILGHQRIAGLSLGPSLWASRVLPCDWQKWGVTKAPGGLTTWTGNRATANVTRGGDLLTNTLSRVKRLKTWTEENCQSTIPANDPFQRQQWLAMLVVECGPLSLICSVSTGKLLSFTNLKHKMK